MKAVLFSLFFALALTQVLAVDSSCNGATCSTSSDCLIGKCCNDKCVDYSVNTILAAGAKCTTGDACNICGTGYYCNGTNCAVPSTNCVKVNQETCACDDTLTCQAGNVCFEGFCRKSNLPIGDYCLDGTQCTSTNCTENRCTGPEIGATCTSTCAYGAYCAFGVQSVCTARPDVGGDCSVSIPCMDFLVCSGGKCAAMGNVSLGDACTADTDCQGTDACISQVCTATTGRDCSDKTTMQDNSCNSYTSQCSCNGTANTACTLKRNLCNTQHAAYISCLMEHECSYNYGSFMTLGSNSSCAFRNCQEEYFDYSCCSGCGTAAIDSIITTSYGLTCSATGHTYTKPPAVCNACPTALAAGTCGTATSQNTENPTSTDNNNASASLKAFVCLIALLVAAAL